MNGSGCAVTIDSVIVEEVGRVPNFVRFRLGARVVTEDEEIRAFLKVIAEGEDGLPVKEYVVAGMASLGAPAVLREVVLDEDVFSAIRKWRIAAVVCYAAADPRTRCECQPSELCAIPCGYAAAP